VTKSKKVKVNERNSVVNNIAKGLDSGNCPAEMEMLSVKDEFNEYILTSLRTKWGIDAYFVKSQFGEQFYLTLI